MPNFHVYISSAVLEVGDGVFEVLSTSGDTHLGGDDFDKVCIVLDPISLLIYCIICIM